MKIHQQTFAVLAFGALLLANSAVAQTPTPKVSSKMKALVYHEFGGPEVLRLEEVDKPVPKDNQVLVKVRGLSVNPLDWHFMEGTPYLGRPMAFGFLKPTVTQLGVDYAGIVEAVGRNIKELKPGDEVYGNRFGAFAEYVVATEKALALKPASLTFEQAASLPVAAITALQALRDYGKIQPGQKVLINGASGGVGTFAVQIAKSFGAEVTGVCSGRNVELVRSLGADHVIDYTKEDFTTRPERYDLVLDNVGNQPLSGVRRVLNPKGIYVVVGGGGVNDSPWTGPLISAVKMVVARKFATQGMTMMLAEINQKDLAVLNGLIESGKVKPVIDKSYPFHQLPEAMRYLEQGHAKGKVVIQVTDNIEPLTPTAGPGAEAAGKPGPLRVAFQLIAVPLAVLILPIIAALVLNRRFKRQHPEAKPFRWGYYFSIMSIVAGLILGLFLEAGAVAVIVCGLIYGVLAWFFLQRRHWAWITLTILSFNPIAWIVNAIYLRKRWAEPAATAATG
jgi:NADPH:quinone reductase-like Zn-dependent oxidoreductase